jgi:1-acyl-sn-glycerol-3-phosphate acyltransferase
MPGAGVPVQVRERRINRAVRGAASRGAEIGRNCQRLDVPWARCGFARMLRELILGYVLQPIMAIYTRRRVRGREHFDGLGSPVILVANHSSHLDTPTLLRALPAKWRHRTAVAAAADYWYRKRLVAHAVSLLFNTVPIHRRGGGLGKGSTEHVDRLIDERWNLLVFAEGTRSRDGRIGKLRSGAAVIASEHDMPIVPVYVTGTHEAMPPGRSWPRRKRGRFLSRRHRVEVHFGEPIRPLRGEQLDSIMKRVRAFYESETGTSLPASRGSSEPAATVRAPRADDARPAERPPLSPVA